MSAKVFGSQREIDIAINPTLLRIVIQEKGLTQKKFAELVGVTTDTVQNWVWGRNAIHKDNYAKVCDVLQVSPQLLVLHSGELVERGRTARVMRFHARELLGQNDAPDYREVQLVEADLATADERDAAEEEVREEEVTVYGEDQPSESGESDPEPSDEEPSA